MKILSSFSHFHVVSNPFDLVSSGKHKKADILIVLVALFPVITMNGGI